jgi:hypothetical protein
MTIITQGYLGAFAITQGYGIGGPIYGHTLQITVCSDPADPITLSARGDGVSLGGADDGTTDGGGVA